MRSLRIVGRHMRRTLPVVERELDRWRHDASHIPNDTLRHLALKSLREKQFHCDGGSVFATWLITAHRTEGWTTDKGSTDPYRDTIRFVVAFQTISDYLDNLCDRTDSLDEKDFRQLHASMFDALTPWTHGGTAPAGSYYNDHPHRGDGGYLATLVATCRDVVTHLPRYSAIEQTIRRLVSLYVDLQVYKHLHPEVRKERLVDWFEMHESAYETWYWWEFAAASGSTLGVFALIAEAARAVPVCDPDRLIAVYFPWICALHILLDYMIDQEEDRREGDLNFVAFYRDRDEMEKRMTCILNEALTGVQRTADRPFHRAVIFGLLGLYLSDPKVADQRLKGPARRLMRKAGWTARVVHVVASAWRRWAYRRPVPTAL